MTGRARGAAAVRIVAWVLAVSYLIGAPLVAFLEYNGQVMSARFGIPPLLIYATSAAQVVLAVGILRPRFAVASAALLSVIAAGAVFLHLRIGSPLTAVPALIYVVVQLWFITATRKTRRG